MLIAQQSYLFDRTIRVPIYAAPAPALEYYLAINVNYSNGIVMGNDTPE